jgi:hypothetical protein
VFNPPAGLVTLRPWAVERFLLSRQVARMGGGVLAARSHPRPTSAKVLKPGRSEAPRAVRNQSVAPVGSHVRSQSPGTIVERPVAFEERTGRI